MKKLCGLSQNAGKRRVMNPLRYVMDSDKARSGAILLDMLSRVRNY
jgi:hypothetical protein